MGPVFPLHERRQDLFEAINSTNRRDIWINNQEASQPGAILNIIFSFDFFFCKTDILLYYIWSDMPLQSQIIYLSNSP